MGRQRRDRKEPSECEVAQEHVPNNAFRRRRRALKGESSRESVPENASSAVNDRTAEYPRLGYACLNTVLRREKPPVFCSRTCRLATIADKGLQHAKDLGIQNLFDLEKMILWNEERGIRFLRISSGLFPFAAHPVHGYSLQYATEDLVRVGQLANRLGHRLTTHPGQYDQLGSLSLDVVENTVRDLKYHAEMLDLMGLGKDSVMILHVGGVYGDKTATLQRWQAEFFKLPRNVRDRIVLENDDVSYTVRDILPTCQRLSIPLVFDWHHHAILNEYSASTAESFEGETDDGPGPASIGRPFRDDPEFAALLVTIEQTWTRRGIRQKQHYSESRAGAVTASELRAHSDRISSIPRECHPDIDLMLEAKDKEQAVLTLYRDLRIRDIVEEVIWEPPPETKKVVDRVTRSGGKKRAYTDVTEVAAKRTSCRRIAKVHAEECEVQLEREEEEEEVEVAADAGKITAVSVTRKAVAKKAEQNNERGINQRQATGDRTRRGALRRRSAD